MLSFRKFILFFVILAGCQSLWADGPDYANAARAYAGLPSDQGKVELGLAYAAQIERSWADYEQRVAAPLRRWVAAEVGKQTSGRIFYPFSGPDLLTVFLVYPDGAHYTLIAMQKAGRPIDLAGSQGSRQAVLEKKLAGAWDNICRLGYFRTLDLDDDQKSEARIGVTTFLMAFAARLGFTVDSVTPIVFNAQTGRWVPSTQADEAWNSVRLHLKKGERQVVVDYVSLDLSDSGLAHSAPMQRWLIDSANAPVLLKAASHLLQKDNFSMLRNTLISNAELVVQDETGLSYGDLQMIGNVKLYGHFTTPHALFTTTKQPALAKAYQEASPPPQPVPFAFSYLKGAEARSMQIAVKRKSP